MILGEGGGVHHVVIYVKDTCRSKKNAPKNIDCDRCPPSYVAVGGSYQLTRNAELFCLLKWNVAEDKMKQR